jgi:hypothetical protein
LTYRRKLFVSCRKDMSELDINAHLNPFIIGGDFDGDGLTDFAIAVNNKTNSHEGIVFCFAKRPSLIFSAGRAIPGSNDKNEFTPNPLPATLRTTGAKAIPATSLHATLTQNASGLAE